MHAASSITSINSLHMQAAILATMTNIDQIGSMQTSLQKGYVAVNMHGSGSYAVDPQASHGRIPHVDVHALSNSIRSRFITLPEKPMETRKHTIFRAPHHVRLKSRDLYEPQVVSIGPYHHGKTHLKCMEEHKLRYLRDFLSRRSDAKGKDVDVGTQLEMCLINLQDLEPIARKRYDGAIHPGRGKFLEMLLLDGCFLLEFLIKNNADGGGDGVDGVVQANWNWHLMNNDLLMLENQIPFFVLRKLFDLVLEPGTIRPRDDRNIAIEYHEGVERSPRVDLVVTHIMWDGRKKTVTLGKNDFFHLLHLYHHCFIPPLDAVRSERRLFLAMLKVLNPVKLLSLTLTYVPLRFYFLVVSIFRARSSGAIPTRIPCASKLMDAGVRFKARASDNFLDVHFDNIDGVLKIPLVRIQKTTKSRFMNLVAFEQCGLVEPRNMTSYAQFMDYMIDSSKDVAILQQCGIIESVLGSDEETAAFFNQLSDCAAMDPERGYLGGVFRDIINYCNLEWHEWRARFKRDYFSNPWTILSLAAAIVLLILTFLQTFFAIYAYYHPRSPSS